jgi:hypothetical protein
MASESRTLTAKNADELAEWCQGRVVIERDALDTSVSQPGINLRVAGGEVQRASVGDAIIKLNDGTFTIFR